MKDNINILALLLLLIHLVSWSVLHVLPHQAGVVVFNKYCKRELTKKEQLPATVATTTASELTEHEQQMPPVQQVELKLCSANYIIPPATVSVAFTLPVLNPQLPVHRQSNYRFLSTSFEPDPPKIG